mmetsp:Transcript_775/g.1638  ORF Transcript_775/g.1638 Transcript_775/m.1638 type:complete len:229 (-) Transcript_775:1168-1854(-)
MFGPKSPRTALSVRAASAPLTLEPTTKSNCRHGTARLISAKRARNCTSKLLECFSIALRIAPIPPSFISKYFWTGTRATLTNAQHAIDCSFSEDENRFIESTRIEIPVFLVSCATESSLAEVSDMDRLLVVLFKFGCPPQRAASVTESDNSIREVNPMFSVVSAMVSSNSIPSRPPRGRANRTIAWNTAMWSSTQSGNRNMAQSITSTNPTRRPTRRCFSSSNKDGRD